jgi:hypothetical protein
VVKVFKMLRQICASIIDLAGEQILTIKLACCFHASNFNQIYTFEKVLCFYSLKHVGKNLAISLQEFLTLSFLYRKRTIKRILLAFLFQTSALPVAEWFSYVAILLIYPFGFGTR